MRLVGGGGHFSGFSLVTTLLGSVESAGSPALLLSEHSGLQRKVWIYIPVDEVEGMIACKTSRHLSLSPPTNGSLVLSGLSVFHYAQ